MQPLNMRVLKRGMLERGTLKRGMLDKATFSLRGYIIGFARIRSVEHGDHKNLL